MATELTHFIGGKHAKGTSGRFADAYWPMTGEVASSVPRLRTPWRHSQPGRRPIPSVAPAC